MHVYLHSIERKQGIAHELVSIKVVNIYFGTFFSDINNKCLYTCCCLYPRFLLIKFADNDGFLVNELMS